MVIQPQTNLSRRPNLSACRQSKSSPVKKKSASEKATSTFGYRPVSSGGSLFSEQVSKLKVVDLRHHDIAHHKMDVVPFSDLGVVTPPTFESGSGHSTKTAEWLTPAEAARHLKIKTRTLLLWVRSGKAPGHKLSGTHRHVWRFLRAELDAMLVGPSVCSAEKESK